MERGPRLALTGRPGPGRSVQQRDSQLAGGAAARLAIPGTVPWIPAVIVAQTLVELVSELVYVKLLSRLAAKPTLMSDCP